MGLMLGIGLFEIFLVVSAQEKTTPWPPPPVRHSAEDEAAPPRRPALAPAYKPKAKNTAPAAPQAALPPITDSAPLPLASPVAEAPNPVIHADLQQMKLPVIMTVGAQLDEKNEPLPPPTFPALPVPAAAAPSLRGAPDAVEPVNMNRAASVAKPPTAPRTPVAPGAPAAAISAPPPALPLFPEPKAEPAPPISAPPVFAPMPSPEKTPAVAPLASQSEPSVPAPAEALAPTVPTSPMAASPLVEKTSMPPEPVRSAVPKPRELTRVHPNARLQSSAPSAPPPPPPASPPPEVHRVFVPAPAPPPPPPAVELKTLPRLAPLAPGPMRGTPAGWSFQTPRLLLEKRGAASLQAGETATYFITVRNPGDERIAGLQIEEALPPQVRPLSAEPEAAFANGRVRWTQPALGPREEMTVALAVQASAPVQIGPTTSVSLTAVGSAQAAPSAPSDSPPRGGLEALQVQVQGPGNVAVGQAAVFRISFTNQGKEPLRSLRLFGYLPEGLAHPAGPHIEADVAHLAAGATRTETLTTTAKLPGHFTVAVKLVGPSGAEVEAQTALEVGKGGLAVQQVAMARLAVGAEGEVRFEVTNQTPRPLQQVGIMFALPEEVDYLKSSDQGLYQPNSRLVYWVLDQLTPGQVKAVALRVQGRKAGKFTGEVVARAEGAAESTAATVIAVEGTAELSVRIIDQENPLPLNKTSSYEIRVANPGSAPANGIAVRVVFSEGLQPLHAQGPTRFHIGPQEINFEPLPFLAAQGEQVYRVSASGQKPGEQRLRVHVSSDQDRPGVTRAHATQVLEAAGPDRLGAPWAPAPRGDANPY
jgi:uncharacterized repeat protein (TIGR01451 family)